MALFDSILSSATGGVRSVYKGILGGLARQLPVRIGGLGESSLPSTVPEMQYLGGPQANPLFSVVITAPSNKEGGETVSVTAFLDGGGGLSLGSKAEYDAPFKQGLLELLDSPKIESAIRLMGIRTVTQSMTSQIWQGSSHMGMSLNLLFIAQTDAAKEVIAPIKQLLGLTLPSVSDSRFLSAPGPRVKFKAPDAGAGEASISGTISKGVDVMSNVGKSALKEFGGSLGAKLTGDQTNIPSFKEATDAATSFFDVITVENKNSISIGNFLHFDSVVIQDVQANWEEIFDPSGQPMVAKVTVQFETHQVPTIENLDTLFPTTAAASSTSGTTPGAAIADGVNGVVNRVGGSILGSIGPF